MSYKTSPFLQLPAILAEVSRAISSVSRVTKRQGCSGLKDLAKTLGPSLGEETSGRRLMRRVLSQIPGRTWEGKDELLEAVVALCAAGKGSAVTLEPFVWSGVEETGGGGGGEGSGGPASSASRGVKRARSSEPLDTEDEGQGDEGEEEEEEEASESMQQADGAGASGTSASAGPGAQSSGGDGDNDSSDDNDAAGKSSDGTAFEYQDKLGDLGEASAPASVAPAGEGMQTQLDQQPNAGGEPRKDAAALEAGLASLDMEDDSPIPFGEVASLMLSQLRR